MRSVGCARRGSTTTRSPRPRHVSLELVLTAHPTEATRGRSSRPRRGSVTLLAELDAGETSSSARPRRSPSSGRPTRSPAAPARRRRDPPRALVLRAEPARRGRGARRLPRGDPGRAAPPLASAPGSAATWTGTRTPGPDTIREALDRARALALAATAPRCASWRRRSGSRSTLVVGLGRAPRVDRARRARAAAYAEQIGEQNRDEPYRRKLCFVWWRLGNDGYARAEELQADLDVLDRSLRAHGGERIADGRLADLRRRVELFGFHVAKLDVRFHATELGERTPRVRESSAPSPRRRSGSGSAPSTR